MVSSALPRHRRARRPDDKHQRRGDILHAAARVLTRTGEGGFTMAAVAATAGLAKGTLYLYFATREGLLLALLGAQLEDWFDRVDQELARGGRWTGDRLARVLEESLDGREMMVGLLAVLGTIIEHNLDLPTARRFKQRLAQRLAATGAAMDRRVPTAAGGARTLLHINALAVGLWQAASPAPVMRQLLSEPGMEVCRVDFRRDLRAAMQALLRGAAA